MICDMMPWGPQSRFWSTVVVTSLLKLLFLAPDLYKSTDFEVHRNWLAITHSLPVEEWYKESTSQWTLDYPPFFAWFEYLLSHLAAFFDPGMLVVANLGHASRQTVIFQRLSVILGDLFLALGARSCAKGIARLRGGDFAFYERSEFQLAYLLLSNAGLLIVDHVHFQYNGFLFGVLLYSLGNALQGRYIKCGVAFAALLNLKHIYLYCAPVFFVYLLKAYCLQQGDLATFIANVAQLGAAVLALFGLAWIPFIYLGQAGAVVARLFPFRRGLCHAYWAPNFWALYNVLDKALTFAAKKLNIFMPSREQASMTGGLVQEFEHQVLPSVSPMATFILAFLAMLPALAKLWRCSEDPINLVRAVALCSFASYLFGWHVHEKAILLVLIPLHVTSFVNSRDAKTLLLLSTTGHASLLPLLFRPEEALLKITLAGLSFLLTAHWLAMYYKAQKFRDILGSQWEMLYFIGLAGLYFFEVLVFPLWPDLQMALPFLPLLMYSTYCTIGMLFAWFRLYMSFLKS